VGTGVGGVTSTDTCSFASGNENNKNSNENNTVRVTPHRRALERRSGFRTEDFAGLASIARSDDDGYSRIRGGATILESPRRGTTRGDAKPAKADGIQPVRCSSEAVSYSSLGHAVFGSP
jgi:hypothetical protein